VLEKGKEEHAEREPWQNSRFLEDKRKRE